VGRAFVQLSIPFLAALQTACGARQSAGEHGVTTRLGLPEQATPGATSTSGASPRAAQSVARAQPAPPLAGGIEPGTAPLPLVERPLCSDTTAYCVEVLAGDFAAALAREPGRFEAHVGLGRAAAQNESMSYGAGGDAATQARQHFQDALWRAPTSPVVQLELARIELSLGHGETARTSLEALALGQPNDAELQAALGIARLSTGAVSESVGPLRRAQELDPRRIERYLTLGTAQMLNDRPEEAERTYRAAIALDSSSPDAHGNLGALLLVLGRLTQARAHLERALVLAPKRATFVSNLSYLALLEGDFVRAQSEAERAIALDSGLGSAWLNLGLAQVRQKKYVDGKRSFQRAQTLDPTDPRPRDNLKELAELAPGTR